MPDGPANSQMPQGSEQATVWDAEGFIELAHRALAERSFPTGRYVNGRVVSVLRSPMLGNASGVAVGFSTIPPGASTEAHHHVAEEIAYIMSGTGYVEIGDERFDLGPGSVIFTPSDSVHRTTATGSEPLVSVWVYSPSGSELRWLTEDEVVDERPATVSGAEPT